MNRRAVLIGYCCVLALVAALWQPLPAEAEDSSVSVVPTLQSLPDGGTVATFDMPDGSIMRVPTPPVGFDALDASDAELAEYDFPSRPTNASQLALWTTVMQTSLHRLAIASSLSISRLPSSSDPSSEAAPPEATTPVSSVSDSAASGALGAEDSANWSGYVAGTESSQTHHFVEIEGEFVVPSSITGLPCLSTNSNTVGIWVGLGGTSQPFDYDDLTQEGVVCGDSAFTEHPGWTVFDEFANTWGPVQICGNASYWAIPPGDTAFVELSYDPASDTATYYVSDINTDISMGCTRSKPDDWTFDGNTAEYIAEANHATSESNTMADFGTARFTDAWVKSVSDDWYTLGSRNLTEDDLGLDGTDCASPGPINPDNESFKDNWHQETCPVPPPFPS